MTTRATGLDDHLGRGTGRINAPVLGAPGCGNSLDIDAKILTPKGWRRNGDLAVGDLVIGSDGKPSEVMGIYDQGLRHAYRLTTNDGANVVCDAEHLWAVETRKQRLRRLRGLGGRGLQVVTTGDLIDRRVRDSRTQTKGGYHFYLPLAEAAQLEEVSLPIDPYLMGVLLANGSLSSDVVNFSTNDSRIAERVIERNPGLSFAEHTYATSTVRRWVIHKFHSMLQPLGLDQTLSRHKFIPDLYLDADEMSRRDLLAGLMDCDGSVTAGKRAGYYSVSKQLAEGVQELVWSLGGIARLDTDNRGEYTVWFWLADSPFWLARKALNYQPRPWFRAVESIEPAEEREMRCIRVASSDQLYVTEGHILARSG